MERDLEKYPARRPLSWFVLLVICLLVSLGGWTRMVYSILNWYWLNYAGVKPGPLYLVVTGGLWGLVGLVALVWMWMRRPGYRWAGSAAALFFALAYWVDRLLFANTASGMQNVIFAVATTLLGLSYVLITLRPCRLRQPKGFHKKPLAPLRATQNDREDCFVAKPPRNDRSNKDKDVED